jgi:hypothetical protein
MNGSAQMRRVVFDLLYFHGLAEAFRSTQDFHLRVKNDPWLPLVVERHGDEVSVTHYGERGLDQTRDPEMVFSLDAIARASRGTFQGWVPMTLEPGGFGRAHVVCTITSQRQLVWLPRQVREAEAFAALWARNLRAQGFVQRHSLTQITSLTHADALAQALSGREVPVPIAHTVVPCADGTAIHRYTFPDDLPCALRPAAYRQAEAALKAAWSDWARYGFGISGQGLELHTRPLPVCTCNE